ncbi:hypothetical protein BgiBS90_005132, partial [Biomphalaria glabrata]
KGYPIAYGSCPLCQISKPYLKLPMFVFSMLLNFNTSPRIAANTGKEKEREVTKEWLSPN